MLKSGVVSLGRSPYHSLDSAVSWLILLLPTTARHSQELCVISKSNYGYTLDKPRGGDGGPAIHETYPSSLPLPST